MYVSYRWCLGHSGGAPLNYFTVTFIKSSFQFDHPHHRDVAFEYSLSNLGAEHEVR